MDTFEKVKGIIVSALNCDEADVTKDAHLSNDLGADSLDAVELIMSLEEAFDIAISEDQAKELATVGEIVALIDSLK